MYHWLFAACLVRLGYSVGVNPPESHVSLLQDAFSMASKCPALFRQPVCYVKSAVVWQKQHSQSCVAKCILSHCLCRCVAFQHFSFETVPLMKFTYFVCARLLGESHARWLRSLLCWCDICQVFVWHPSCLCDIYFRDVCQVFVQHLSSVCVICVKCLCSICQVFVCHLSSVCVTSVKCLCNIYQIFV